MRIMKMTPAQRLYQNRLMEYILSLPAKEKAETPVQSAQVEELKTSNENIDHFDKKTTHSVDQSPVTDVAVTPLKRGRGRPRKTPLMENEPKAPVVKRGRGRPRKIVCPVQLQWEASKPKRPRGRPRKAKLEMTSNSFEDLKGFPKEEKE